jgi:hypothetical protein
MDCWNSSGSIRANFCWACGAAAAEVEAEEPADGLLELKWLYSDETSASHDSNRSGAAALLAPR